ncbi:MAG TPA: hypothetical protein P5316_13655 [Phycisphaerae bacterium]|nr:hypothetical protein [Phycisphaerae bacterium]
MGRQYSAKTFLRNVPNDLLKQYFQKQGIDLGLDWVRLNETEVNPIFVALEALPATTPSQVALQGWVAATANHTEKRRLGAQLDEVFLKIDPLLTGYADQQSNSSRRSGVLAVG